MSIAADYLFSAPYTVCEVSEEFHWRGKPGLIWADCWNLDEARTALERQSMNSIWMKGRDGVVLGIWDGSRWIGDTDA